MTFTRWGKINFFNPILLCLEILDLIADIGGMVGNCNLLVSTMTCFVTYN